MDLNRCKSRRLKIEFDLKQNEANPVGLCCISIIDNFTPNRPKSAPVSSLNLHISKCRLPENPNTNISQLWQFNQY